MCNERRFRPAIGGARWAVAIFLAVWAAFSAAGAVELTWDDNLVTPSGTDPSLPLGQGFYAIGADGNPLSTGNVLYTSRDSRL